RTTAPGVDMNLTGISIGIPQLVQFVNAGNYHALWASVFHGNDTIAASSGADTLLGYDGNDTISGGDGADSISGNAGSDSASGGAGNDQIVGNDGSDHLDGGAGNDVLTGANVDRPSATDADVLLGGAGADWLILDRGTADGGDGVDYVEAHL